MKFAKQMSYLEMAIEFAKQMSYLEMAIEFAKQMSYLEMAIEFGKQMSYLEMAIERRFSFACEQFNKPIFSSTSFTRYPIVYRY